MNNVSLIDGHIDDDVIVTEALTDEQIIKAIERCIGKDFTALWYVETLDQRTPISMRDILRVISNQKAEIERLKAECGNQSTLWSQHYESIFETAKETIKAEAVKEFAETLKVNYSDFIGDCYYEDSFRAYIDNYVKEMEGEG